MAEAVVNAAMRMDNKQFMDAAKASTYQMQQVKKQSADLARGIAGANAVSTGLANIMSGNLSAGFASVSAGLNGLAPKVMALLGPIGLVVAAFTAAYQAGKKLDSMIGISDAIGKRFGGDTSATDEMAAQTAIMRERRRGMQEAARIADESAEMAEKRLKGVAKLEADYARERADVEKRLADATNADVKASLSARLAMMAGFHAQDVAATRKAERDKLQAVQEAEAAKAKAVAVAVASRTRGLAEQNESMRIAQQEGVNRIQMEFERDVRAVDEQMAAPDTTEEQRGLLAERRSMLSANRQRALDELTAQGQSTAEAKREFLPARADTMASTGGFLGGERLNITTAKTAEKLQQENNQILKTNVAAVAELTAQVQQLASAMTGSVQ